MTLSDVQRKHVAVVLDLFQAKGTTAKIEDNFTEDAVYQDLFTACKDRVKSVCLTPSHPRRAGHLYAYRKGNEGVGRHLCLQSGEIVVYDVVEVACPAKDEGSTIVTSAARSSSRSSTGEEDERRYIAKGDSDSDE